MKKSILCVCIVLLMLLTVGCEKRAYYRFLYNMEEINTIEIVKMDIDVLNGKFEQIPVCTIEDKAAFIDDFLQVDCFSLYNDPTAPGDDAIVIKIIYNSGEYELIAASGQSQYTKERQFQYYKGHRYFDKREFENLISKYVGNAAD